MAALDPITPTAPPLPGRAVLEQRWSDAVFLHWRVPASSVASYLPAGTRPDEFDGSSWVGLIPFVLSRTRPLPLPPVPWLGTFVEINVRLYSVDDDGRRGVVFRSLDAEHLLAVLAARAAFGLPYEWSAMRATRRHDDRGVELDYRSARHRALPAARGDARRAPARPARTLIRARMTTGIAEDELASFLTARWGFHERRRGRTIWARNSHAPWPLRRAELLELDDELLAAAGFPGLAGRAPDSVLASPGVLARFSAAEPVGSRRRRNA
ncbi:MAG TPA: DUF2071 domain-containing protein [Agromyces sp.]|nr:DUF2071 domain-containing protein [Agromyces sp.]